MTDSSPSRAPAPLTQTLPAPLTQTLPAPLTHMLPAPLTQTLPAPLTQTLPAPLTQTLPRATHAHAPRAVTQTLPAPLTQTLTAPLTHTHTHIAPLLASLPAPRYLSRRPSTGSDTETPIGDEEIGICETSSRPVTSVPVSSRGAV